MLVVGIAGCGLRSTDEKAQPKQKAKAKVQKNDYVAKGMEFLANKDVANAIQNFDMAIRQDPENLTNYIVLSQVYYKLGNFERSTDTLTAALKLDQENGEIYYLLAMSLSQNDDTLDAAYLTAEKAVQMFIKEKNEPGLKKSVTLLKSLKDKKESAVQQVY